MPFTAAGSIKRVGIVFLTTLFLLIFINYSWNTEFRPSHKISNVWKTGQHCNYVQEDLNTILVAIERALNFFDNLKGLVLDAAVGTRVLEAQLTIITNAYGDRLAAQLLKRLRQIHSRSSTISEVILDNFMNDGNISALDKIAQSGWVNSPKLWEMPDLNKWKPQSDMEKYFNYTTQIKKINYFRDSFQGGLSDNCILQQFFCKDMKITLLCKEYFFKKPASSYTLNHQVLYFIMAEKNLCHKSEEYVKVFQDVGGWEQFRKDLCGKVWFLANVISSKGFTPRYGDLFTEQVAVCSLAGYSNFLKKEWLYQILSRQTTKGDEGCFLHRDFENRMIVTALSDDDYVDVEYPQNVSYSHLLIPRESLGPLQPKANLTRHKERRTKRHEQVVLSETGEQCLAHLSSMGTMALAMHLRYLIETCDTETWNVQ